MSEYANRLGAAQEHWRNGEIDDARDVYRGILDEDEASLEALVQLGQLEREQECYDRAAALHRRAVELAPNAIAWTALGRTLSDSGDAEGATNAFRAAIEDEPRYAPAHLHLGELLGAMGRLRPAQECFARAAQLDPQDFAARHNLGIGAQLAGQPAAASEHFKAAIQLNPKYWRSWQAFGDLCRQNGDLANALACYRELIALAPDADNLLRLGATLQLLGDYDEAINCYRQVLETDPLNADAVYNLGTCFQATGELDEAERLFNGVLEQRPDHVSAAAALAGVHDRRGDYETGLALLAPMTETVKANPELWVSLGRLARHAGRSAEFAPRLEAALEEQEFSKIDRSRIAFTAGSLRDAEGDYDRAFHHFRIANALKPHHYDARITGQSVDRLLEVFDANLLKRLQDNAAIDAGPVFIVGMPRSGSTLLERILAAHPQVATIGESPLLSRSALSLASAENPYPDCVATASSEALRTAAQAYLDALPDEHDRVVDKMLSNVFHVGLVAALFGNAKIIHCARHPLDTLLSCYTHDFAGTQVGFAYDFDDLAHYYRQYRRLVAHWESVQAVPMLTVNYEDVVSDTESSVRELLGFLDLPWEPGCLEFHANRDVAHTASYAQVRRPVYRDSVGRHGHYREALAPLADALADYL